MILNKKNIFITLFISALLGLSSGLYVSYKYMESPYKIICEKYKLKYFSHGCIINDERVFLEHVEYHKIDKYLSK